MMRDNGAVGQRRLEPSATGRRCGAYRDIFTACFSCLCATANPLPITQIFPIVKSLNVVDAKIVAVNEVIFTLKNSNQKLS
jgi:hypothetical protein